MDLPVCFVFVTLLLVAVQADPTDQGPQMFSEGKPPEPKRKHKREPKYEMQMKEVILYLTPTQIRALEAGQGLPQQEGQQYLQSSINEQIKEQIQNVYKEEAQKQQQGGDSEVSQEQKNQLPEPNQNKPPKNTKEQHLAPVNNAPQVSQSELQKREKYNEPPLQFQLLSPLQYKGLRDYRPPLAPHVLPSTIPHLKQQVLQSHAPLPQVEPKLVQSLQAAEPHFEKIVIPQEKKHWHPQNYAYLYFYPEGKPINSEKLDLLYPHTDIHEQRPGQLLQHPYPEFSSFSHSPKFQLIPYDYGYQNKLEAQQILQAQLQDHELNARRFEAHDLATHHLDLNRNPHQLEVAPQELLAQKELAAQYLQHEQGRKLESYQGLTAEKMVEQQVESGRLEAQNSKEPQFQAELKSSKSDESDIDIQQLDAFHREQMKEILEARKLQAKLEAQEREAFRLDAELEAEQLKAEKMRQEQEKLAFLRKLEPKRTQIHSILKPLFQGHNIAESLERQKANFPHSKINLEKGFKPLQYAPDYNDEKYRKEVEKILKRNHIEKQKALAKAAAIANEPPEIIMTNEESAPERRHPTMEIVNHVKVSVPTPVYLPVPEPFEVKVPQPYPVPLEIIRPIPIPIVKMEKVEVEKPVPVEVEKRVPFPVTKNVYIQVDKPYFVEKVVPVEVKKKIPVEIPIHKPQKFSIIRHIWEH